jgi:hypothetical protein
MMTEQEQQQAAGSAIAAFTLAQLSFWHLIKTETLPHDEAIRMLKDSVAANAPGGPANQYAAQKLQMVLDMVQRSHGTEPH